MPVLCAPLPDGNCTQEGHLKSKRATRGPLVFRRKYVSSRHLLRTKKQGGQVATPLGVGRRSLLQRFALIDAGNRRRSARKRTGNAWKWTGMVQFVRAMRP